MRERPDCSVVVPTRDKADDLGRCLRAILDQDRGGISLEVVVVDDGSTDRTPELLGSFDAGDVPFRAVRAEGRGPARARNEGIRHARGSIVCMVDDDAVPEPGWLRALLRPFETPGVVGAEGRVVPSGDDYGPLGMSPVNERGGVYLTCNMAYRRDVLLRVGGFDEGFPFPAFEDTDLAAAVRRHGRIAWAPDAVVHHPRRRWTLARALREVRFYGALLRYARRHRALGWEDRPTRHPVARTIWSATVAVPAGRVIKGLAAFPRHPQASLRYMGIALAQAAGAALWIWGPALRAARSAVPPRLTSLDPSEPEAGVTADPGRV